MVSEEWSQVWCQSLCLNHCAIGPSLFSPNLRPESFPESGIGVVCWHPLYPSITHLSLYIRAWPTLKILPFPQSPGSPKSGLDYPWEVSPLSGSPHSSQSPPSSLTWPPGWWQEQSRWGHRAALCAGSESSSPTHLQCLHSWGPHRCCSVREDTLLGWPMQDISRSTLIPPHSFFPSLSLMLPSKLQPCSPPCSAPLS